MGWVSNGLNYYGNLVSLQVYYKETSSNYLSFPHFVLKNILSSKRSPTFVLLRGVVRKLSGSENYIFQARGWYRKIQDWLQKKESYQRRLRGSVSSSPMVLLLSEFPFPDIMESW